MSEPATLARPDGTSLAYHHRPGTGPTILFLPGYASDMTGGKATALDAWAGEQGRAMLRFDYAGCGASEGRFGEQTLASWRDDALLVIDQITSGPLLLVGSSMGGWIMLLVALARPDRIAGLIGIAAAPDFTDWGFDDGRRETLAEQGYLAEPSPYGDEPTLTTLDFWRSGQANLLLGGAIAIDAPVTLIQGMADEEVPASIALRLTRALRSADVQTIFVKGGDHRLSRDQDIRRLIGVVAQHLDGL
ncbi:alpha/beta hydrolase [Sphingomonas naphthae]|uniref:Alpha/beta hydrolase n=1 Tax=Sphingomonas naphthae TaxID=1813468 RepID=A0ABY7TKN5_9SPHN|nr:alpha/beta hydrolase [Sphingomonas naphthae]WCT73515.1 alpha/beta hydrolase [Sphingomonas naphthae]